MSQPCDGCLGDLECWVCLGSGSLEAADGSRQPCHSCDGSGFCRYCQARPDPRVQVIYLADHRGEPELPRDAGLIAL